MFAKIPFSLLYVCLYWFVVHFPLPAALGTLRPPHLSVKKDRSTMAISSLTFLVLDKPFHGEVFPNTQSKLPVHSRLLLLVLQLATCRRGWPPPAAPSCQSFVWASSSSLSCSSSNLCSRPFSSSFPSPGHTLNIPAVRSPKANPGFEVWLPQCCVQGDTHNTCG